MLRLPANDHFLFQAPWLDGPTALAAVIERSGAMELATTVALVALRGAVPLAKALVALDVLSDGRVIAGVGPGSSQGDYDAVGVSYEERWQRFDEAAAILRSLLRGGPPPQVVIDDRLPAIEPKRRDQLPDPLTRQPRITAKQPMDLVLERIELRPRPARGHSAAAPTNARPPGPYCATDPTAGRAP